MQNMTLFHPMARQIEPKPEAIITGDKLRWAVALSLIVMSAAIFLGLHIASITGEIMLGFLPLAFGWAVLYPLFKRLEA